MRPTVLHLDVGRFDIEKLPYDNDESLTPAPTPMSPTSPTDLVTDNHSSTSGHGHAPMSTGRTLVYLIKGNLGAGLFAIPAAFKDAGLAGGSIGTPIMALLSIHCMHMLVKCTEVMKDRRGNPDMAMDYAEVLETACLTSSTRLSKYAVTARRLIKTALFIKELEFCSVFILFAATYLKQLMYYYAPDLHWEVPICILVLSPLAFGLGCVRNYKYLYPFSYVASSIKAASLLVLFYFMFQDLPHVSERRAWSNGDNSMLLFYGTIIFAFEGVTQVLPLHDNMRTTRHFRGWNGVLNTGMLIISCLYFALGFYGYLKYGEDTYPSITMNLPKNLPVSQIVKIGLIIALMIGYGLQFHAAVEITQPTINRLISKDGQRLAAEMSARLLLFIFAVGNALWAIDLDLYISLVGSFTCTWLCIVFPPLLDLITFWNKMGKLRMLKNIIIMVFGVFAFATGSAVGIIYLREFLSEHRRT